MGLLTPGTTYATKVFTPRLTFQVPVTGWENLSDEQGVYVILSTTSLGDDIAFLVDPHAIDVTGATVAGVNGSVADLATWLQGNDQLTVTTPTPVTVGGLDGLVMDIRIADSATAHPSDCPTRVCVPTLAGADPEPPHNWQWDWGSAGTETQRLYLLANGDSLLAIFVDSLDGTTFDSITAVADKLLATVSFG